MELKGKKVAIMVEEQYQDQEVWYPYFRLKEAGASVVVIGAQKKTYKSKHGYEIAADTIPNEANAADFDAVIVPGGFAPDFMRRHAAMIKFVADAASKGKVLAAICHGPWVLVSAGALKGKRATCFFAIKDDVVNAGAKYEDAEVVVDGNVVTSRKPEDLPAFMREVIRLLRGK